MRILVGACVALLPSVAAAVPVAPPPPPPERAIAVTISPLHLLSPIVELTGEYRVGPKLGVAATLGAGSVTAKDGGGTEHRFTVGELGGSARYYVTGSFARGLQVGGELMYLLVKLDDPMTTVRATGDGLSVSPFIGYKWTGVGGFTASEPLPGSFAMSSLASFSSCLAASSSLSSCASTSPLTSSPVAEPLAGAALPWPGSPPAPAIVVGGIAEPPVPAAEPEPDVAPPPPPPTTSAAATPPPTSASPASANIRPLFDRGACCCGSTCPAADAIDGDGGGYPP